MYKNDYCRKIINLYIDTYFDIIEETVNYEDINGDLVRILVSKRGNYDVSFSVDVYTNDDTIMTELSYKYQDDIIKKTKWEIMQDPLRGFNYISAEDIDIKPYIRLLKFDNIMTFETFSQTMF